MTLVVKLGGSVITEKDRPETLDGAALDRAADAVADHVADRPVDDPGVVVVHGGGSFGHHHADERGVSTATGTHDANAVAAVHGAMKTLNQFVLARLHERDVPAVPVHPLSAGARTDAGGDGAGREALDLSLSAPRTLLAEGFVPVLHGDGVATAGEGVTVVSGDELVVALAEGLDADRVGLCSTVPGVLDDEGAVVPEVAAFDDVADALGASDATDVTGGMAAKVRELLALEAPASVFALDGLGAFFDGETPGTTVRGGD
ncbi:MAG: isopentenyl phosphate kinase [Halolamina sp.]